MIKFTVKDFIIYNSPCFGCNKPATLKIGVFNTETKDDQYYLRPTVDNHCTAVDLKISYNNSIKLYVYHQTNKILTNNKSCLTKYLESHKLFLSCACETNCGNKSESSFLEFDLNKNIVKPVKIKLETLLVKDKENRYMISSSYDSRTSRIHIWKEHTSSSSDINLDVTLLPKSKFKNRKIFIEKMKLYTLFS